MGLPTTGRRVLEVVTGRTRLTDQNWTGKLSRPTEDGMGP